MPWSLGEGDIAKALDHVRRTANPLSTLVSDENASLSFEQGIDILNPDAYGFIKCLAVDLVNGKSVHTDFEPFCSNTLNLQIRPNRVSKLSHGNGSAVDIALWFVGEVTL